MPSLDTTSDFDVVTKYNDLLAKDADLTMPVAAIEALVSALAHSNATTISETLSVLTTASNTLKRSIPNPISLSAGTDLFTRYLVSSLRNTGTADKDFEATRTHLLNNGRLFVDRAKAARSTIAAFARQFIREGSTILTNGGSRVVGAALKAAASAGKEGGVRFKVIYVLPSGTGKTGTHAAQDTEGLKTVNELRRMGVPVATVSEAAVAYAMGKVTTVLVGAEGVVENGGIISRLGTYQIGLLAKSMGKPFYVVAESHKFVRLYPLGQYDLGIEQSVVDFQTELGGKLISEGTENGKKRREGEGVISAASDAVDFTPPDLISGIITESGVLTPSAVSEELIKIWF